MNVATILAKESVSYINDAKAFINSFSTSSLALNYLKNACGVECFEELTALVDSGKIDIDEPLYLVTDTSIDEMYFFSGETEVRLIGKQEIGIVVDDAYGKPHVWYLDDPYNFVAVNIEKAKNAGIDLVYHPLQLQLAKLWAESPFDLPEYCKVLKPADFITHINEQPKGYLHIMLVK